jgi:hypothetical protein
VSGDAQHPGAVPQSALGDAGRRAGAALFPHRVSLADGRVSLAGDRVSLPDGRISLPDDPAL